MYYKYEKHIKSLCAITSWNLDLKINQLNVWSFFFLTRIGIELKQLVLDTQNYVKQENFCLSFMEVNLCRWWLH